MSSTVYKLAVGGSLQDASIPTKRSHTDDDFTKGTISIFEADGGDTISVLGFGSLLSERSSRLTFPELQNFRLARVRNYRRVFGHPTSIFFRRNIACLQSKQMSSLSVEYCDGYAGFFSVRF